MHLGDSSNAQSRGNFRRDLANRRNERFRSVHSRVRRCREMMRHKRESARAVSSASTVAHCCQQAKFS
jgi:hypothetical protein